MKKLLFIMLALWGGVMSARSTAWYIKNATGSTMLFKFKCGSRDWSEEKKVSAGKFASMDCNYGEKGFFMYNKGERWSWPVSTGNRRKIKVT